MRSIFLVYAFLLPGFVFSQKLTVRSNDCKVSRADQQKIERILKYEANLYNNLFNTNLNDTLTIKVNVFPNRKTYDSFIGENIVGLHKTFGFFSPVTDECYVYKYSDYKKTIIHEASHCYLYHNLPSTSRFLIEGMAEFFETLELDDQGKIVFSAQPGRVKLVKDLTGSPSFKLSSYAFAPNSSWGEKEQVPVLYSVAYSVVYYLIKKNPSILKKMLLLLQEGHSFEEAIEFSYGGYQNFEMEYTQFYKATLIKPI